MGDLRAAVAVAQKELRTLMRYPLNFAAFLLLPLYQGVIPSFLFGTAFLVEGRAVGLEASVGTGNLGAFLFAGVFVTGLVFFSLWGIGMGLQNERNAGSLEAIWLTPTGRDAILLGKTLATFAMYVPTQLALLAIGAVFFGARFRAETVAALPALALATAAMVGLAYALAGLAFVVREPGFVVDVGSYLFVQISGVSFPITVLPAVLQLVAFALPTTYAMDVFRQHALGARPVMDPLLEHVVLLGFAVLALPFGRWVFHRAERHVRVQGTLAQY